MNSLDSEDQDDTPLDPEEAAAVAALSDDDIADIDRAILAQCTLHWKKVGYVVGVAMDVYPDRFLEIPDVFYSARIRELASKGQLKSQGNLFRMRYSEICLAHASR